MLSFPSHICLHFWYLAQVLILLFWLLLNPVLPWDSLHEPQGISGGPFHSCLSINLHLSFYNRAHSLSVRGTKVFWGRKGSIQEFLNNNKKKKGVVKNHSCRAILLFYFPSIKCLPVFSCFFSHECSSREFVLKPPPSVFWWWGKKKSLWSSGNDKWVLLGWKGKFVNGNYGWCKVLYSWHVKAIWYNGRCQKSFLAHYKLRMSKAMEKSEKQKNKIIIQNFLDQCNLKCLSWSG